MKIKIKKLHEDAKIPAYLTEGAAACDLYCIEEALIKPGEIFFFKTGIAFEIPHGYYMSISPRSSFCLKKHLIMPNSPAIIDEDYRGDVIIALRNTGDEDVAIEKGERIGQAVFLQYNKAEFEEVEELSETGRGEGNFGSTGKF